MSEEATADKIINCVEFCKDRSNNEIILNDSHNKVRLCHLCQPVKFTCEDGECVTLSPCDGEFNKDGIFLVLKQIQTRQQLPLHEAEAIAKSEFDLLRQNTHKHIVRALQFVPQHGTHFPGFFMESGDFSLYQALYTRTVLNTFMYSDISAEHGLSWMLQAAEGLKFLHNRDVLHRDIKSHNMLLFRRGALLKLCDLELSRVGDVVMTTGKGTGPWMAPEMIRKNSLKDEYNNKVDCYSFGMTMFEIVFRQIPFEGLEVKKIKELLIGEGLDERIQPAMTVDDAEEGRSIQLEWNFAQFNVHSDVQRLLERLLCLMAEKRDNMEMAVTILGQHANCTSPELTKASEEAAEPTTPSYTPLIELSRHCQLATPPNLVYMSTSTCDVSYCNQILRTVQTLTDDESAKLIDILREYRDVIERTASLRFVAARDSDRFEFLQVTREINLEQLNRVICGACHLKLNREICFYCDG